jgi:CheY-like chemotaxis protein
MSLDKFGGLGLGLAISKGLVDLLGGSLTATSRGRGQGATFMLTLRTVAAAKEQAKAPTTQQTAAAARKVLLVEDHPDTAKLMGMLLRSFGLEVTVAKTVAEAVAAVEAHGFDLLLSDIGLPDGSGMDLIRKIHARKPIKGIALSGYGMEEDVRRSLDAGFVAHLTKPVDPRRLEQLLREHLS